MRRPKDPKDPKRKSPQEEHSPPGGRARERLDQFNRQRGLSTETPPSRSEKNEAVREETPDQKKTRTRR